MRLFKIIFLPFLFACCSVFYSNAQNACTTLGQTPSTAFPVCGTNVFDQTTVPLCTNKALTVPNCSNASYTDKNPYWYKFTCYTAGTLGFLITPTDLGDDYDWQLFDITGHDPADVYNNTSLVVTGNWSGTYGATGARAGGSSIIECASTPSDLVSSFSEMPTLTLNHTYLLMVSHYTDSQSGYTLSFGGGTGSITDPLKPAMLSVDATCDGYQLKLKINKPIKCSSIALNGTDFNLREPINILSATGVGCNSSFDTDSLLLNLSDSLKPGTHTLVIKHGTDNSTLIDNCENEIPVSDSLHFQVFGKVPTPLDSIAPISCATQSLQLVFSKSIRCSSIAANGSDFYITGPYPVKVSSTEGFCVDGLSKVIKVDLQNKLQTAGAFTLHLQKGSDGNSIIDECGLETPVPASIPFSVENDTVSAQFTYNLTENCSYDHIDLFNNGGISITSWNWLISSSISSTLQNPAYNSSDYGNKPIQLIVSNGFCSDTVLKTIPFPHDTVAAAFTGPAIYCPDEFALFTDASSGTITQWNWQFGNGHSSNLHVPPPQTYYTTIREKSVAVTLSVTSNKNCSDTIVHYLKVEQNCHIAVPSAFTPNGDGVNDYLYPLNAYKATGLYFSVYNKFGQKIYETKDWTKKWDGTFQGYPQPTDVYVWVLQYTDASGGPVFLKGTTVLIR